MSTYVPNIDDLRIKLCYICRDEELYDQPEDPPRIWIHPCRCALIAHESCLLDWIQSAQARSDRAAENATKCPQCGTLYEIQSKNPFILRALSWASRQMPRIGAACLTLGLVGLVASVSAGIYITCTSYGAYAIKLFFGEEVYDFVLTDDPNNWPIMAYIQLPLIPLNLMLSQLSGYSPLIHTILACLSFTPSLSSLQNFTTNTVALPALWPPSPQIAAILLIPFTTSIYRLTYKRISQRLLGTLNPEDYDDDLRVFANADVNNDEEIAAAADPPPQNDRVGAWTIEIKSPSRIGRHIASALLIPTIASRMGSLLLRLSRHAPVLRQFLGVQPSWRTPPIISLPLYWLNVDGKKGHLSWIFRAFWGGISPWSQLDPVWWRNSIGYGLFVAARDCLALFYRWLVKREQESRKIKDLPFTNVDLSTLDLIVPHP